MEEMKGTTYQFKETLVCHADNIPNVIFVQHYERAGPGYRDVWRWMVMAILPLVSPLWKARVEAGPFGKMCKNKDFWDCITTGDVAFVYAMFQWAMRKYVDGNELENHKRKEEDIADKKRKGITVKLEDETNRKTAFGNVTRIAELDADITVRENTESEGMSDQEERDSHAKDGERNSDDDEEEDGEEDRDKGTECKNIGNNGKSVARVGRKKGEDGFGSLESVRRYNKHGRALDEMLDDEKHVEKIVNSWIEQAMKWVNKEVIEIGSDDDDDSDVGSGNRKRKKREDDAPFIPKERPNRS